MKNAVVVIALGAMLAATSVRAADYCDDKIEPGESPDGKAMAMVSSLASIVLAERYCGAPPTPFSQVYVVVEEAHGCGPRAKLEAEFRKRMKETPMTEAMMADQLVGDLVFEGEKDLSQAEIDRRAKTAIEARLGGCSELLQTRQELLDRYRNPPKWPRAAEE